MVDWLSQYPEGSLVQKAYQFARECLGDAMRLSGETYLDHSVAVARIVHGWRLDEPSVAAALLHHVLEDKRATLREVRKRFGEEVTYLVEGLTRLNLIEKPREESDYENVRKLTVALSKDLRVVLVKLAARKLTMQTIDFLPSEKQKKTAWETMEIYAPLAYRLGMQRLAGELEDLAFAYLYPAEYERLLRDVEEAYAKREAYAESVKPMLRKTLLEHDIKLIRIDSRAKRYSSLYKKLRRYDMDLEKVYDLVALRIIVRSVAECYAALGIIHKLWQPLPGRIKDYISRPKPNGYRSLHTTVFCKDNKITEFQIRTQEMHDADELGIAAHWAYQQVKSRDEARKKWKGVQARHELLWVEQLRNWQKNFTDQKDFIEALKVDFFKDRIFVLTPKNDVIDLPAGATPVDFAYQIHSDIGDQCVGAKVNGKIVPLDYELASGDVVEILTQRGKKPSSDWLRFVKTSIAGEHIRSALGIKIMKKKRPETLEFTVVSEDRIGLLKDLTNVFAESKINIVGLESPHTASLLPCVATTVRCPPLQKQKIEKLLVRLKKIGGVKEVSYKLNR